MPDQKEIIHQQTLLATYRRNLAHYLKQQATLGEVYTPPAIVHGITESRSNIQRIKQILHNWQVPVENHPDDGDEPPLFQIDDLSPSFPRTVDRIQLRQILIASFNEEELRDLTFDMNIDYENLPGMSKAGKARELVAYVERYNRFHDLVELVRRLRPNAFS